MDTAPEEEANLETVPTEERDQPVNLEVGQVAALHLHKYDDEIPQLDKLLSVSDMEVNVEWWIGGWSNNCMVTMEDSRSRQYGVGSPQCYYNGTNFTY